MKVEDLKKAIEEKKKVVTSDNPQVEIARIHTDAVIKLSESDNDNFSQLNKDKLQDETFDYALAISFANRPLRSLEERLKSKDIKNKDGSNIKIEIITLKDFLKEFLIRRHCLNRKRVEEYIEALDAVNPRNTQINAERPGLLNRIV